MDKEFVEEAGIDVPTDLKTEVDDVTINDWICNGYILR